MKHDSLWVLRSLKSSTLKLQWSHLSLGCMSVWIYSYPSSLATNSQSAHLNVCFDFKVVLVISFGTIVAEVLLSIEFVEIWRITSCCCRFWICYSYLSNCFFRKAIKLRVFPLSCWSWDFLFCFKANQPSWQKLY